MAAGGSGLGVALAGALLRDVDSVVDLVAVAAAGALVGCVASLLKALVDLLVVLLGEVLGLIHEATHVCLLPTVCGHGWHARYGSSQTGPARSAAPVPAAVQRRQTGQTASAWRPDSVCTSAHSTCGYRSSREPCSSRPRSVWFAPGVQACTSPRGRLGS